jgi:hypothetical protein
VAAAVSLILVELGTGLGLAAISPWAGSSASGTSFAIGAAIWLIVVQWLASAFGGYITGRLRTKWAGTHTYEVFFRDTAHGLLTWAVATVIGAMVVALAAGSVVGGGVRAAATVASGAAQGATQSAGSALSQSRAYDVDTLFRSAQPNPSASNPNASAADQRGEAARILTTGVANGDVSPADRTYLAQLVAARTGLSQDDAQKRVDQVIAQVKAAETKARQAADAARDATAKFAIFLALAMVIGAFIACAAAALGGQERDKHP